MRSSTTAYTSMRPSGNVELGFIKRNVLVPCLVPCLAWPTLMLLCSSHVKHMMHSLGCVGTSLLRKPLIINKRKNSNSKHMTTLSAAILSITVMTQKGTGSQALRRRNVEAVLLLLEDVTAATVQRLPNGEEAQTALVPSAMLAVSTTPN